ncbi:MAG: dienelactone hydrolase family protein [Gemmatimonadaceae bacterium]
MIEATVHLKTPDGVMPTRTFHPGGGKRSPAVILFMDGVGIRPTLIEMARRIASHGYYVALPDLFYRSAPQAPFDGATVFSDPAERARLMSLIKEVTPARALSDTRVILEFLEHEPAADAGKVGTVGYCMGGGAALSAAGQFPDRVRAAASYHGGRLATDAPDSPHVLASAARGRVYVGYAENDNSFPEEQRQRLEAALTEAGISHSMELYHAAHGFSMSDLPVYNETAAAEHWRTLLGLFKETLG